MPEREQDVATRIASTQRVIESRIYAIRRHKVMLDSDLAGLYGVTTAALNQAVAGIGIEFRKTSCANSRRLCLRLLDRGHGPGVAVANTAQVTMVATASEAGTCFIDSCSERNSLSMIFARSAATT